MGSEHQNRLLALVAHESSYGLFSFAVSKNPPELISDLTIENVYPLNASFRIDLSKFLSVNSQPIDFPIIFLHRFNIIFF